MAHRKIRHPNKKLGPRKNRKRHRCSIPYRNFCSDFRRKNRYWGRKVMAPLCATAWRNLKPSAKKKYKDKAMAVKKRKALIKKAERRHQ